MAGRKGRHFTVVTTEVDTRRELMTVRYEGDISLAETQTVLKDAPAVLARLPRGFRLLVDLSGLHSMEIACAPVIERIMDLCQEKGVSEVVRVIPDPRRDIGMQIMSHFHYDSGVRIATCQTMADAVARLELPATNSKSIRDEKSSSLPAVSQPPN